jgi:biotin-(acetyl-CoA carboxylase) ligase
LAIRIEVLEQGGIAALLGDWRRCAVGLGGPVTVHASNATTHGIAVDVGDDGALLVESAGRVHRFLAAEVHLGSDTTEPAEAK